MNTVLYRKYRPSTFTELCGQEHISKTLKVQIKDKKFSHAYLLIGSRGTGKTSTARLLAKAVNCLNPSDGDPCNECEICTGINNGSVLDVVEIDAASNRGVDDIRTLREQVAYSPVAALYKVFIIDEVHMLTKEAMTALLKTLEEPPPHALFILATTESHTIPATIMSRCQRFDFSRISADVIVARIKHIAENEGIRIDDPAAVLIAKLAEGGLRDAVNLLDLCSGGGSAVTEELVAQSVGIVGRGYLFEMTRFILDKNSAECLKLLDELYTKSLDTERFTADFISHLRDLLVTKTASNWQELITATNEDLQQLSALAKDIPLENILHYIELFSACLDRVKKGGSSRITLETTLLCLCVAELDTSSAALLRRIAALERQISGFNGAVAQTPPPSASAAGNASQSVKTSPAEVPPASPAGDAHRDVPQSPEISARKTDFSAEKFNSWAEVLEKLKELSPIIYALLDNSSAYISGEFMLIDAPNPAFLETVREQPRHKEDIKNALFSVTGTRYKIGPYTKPENITEPTSTDPLDGLIDALGAEIEIVK